QNGISSIHPFNNDQEDNSIRAAREARKALARERKQENVSQPETEADPRKAAVAAALARVKAKKAAQANIAEGAATTDENIVVPTDVAEDPRKAAVAAAIARAKAKKATSLESAASSVDQTETTVDADPRKAAVAAAIARAKAKKAAQAQETDTVSAPSDEGVDTPQDPRKAAVAAAIARVKAKQAAQKSAAVNEE
ncbi:MAG: electron transport complex subunit RsxC, partial [Enterobacterales bacterium]|nr:electron transport complex subunit RsxC [Enterobacterales bacterium]